MGLVINIVASVLTASLVFSAKLICVEVIVKTMENVPFDLSRVHHANARITLAVRSARLTIFVQIAMEILPAVSSSVTMVDFVRKSPMKKNRVNA